MLKLCHDQTNGINLFMYNRQGDYLITVPIYQSKAEEIHDALIEHVITKYCIPDCIIMD